MNPFYCELNELNPIHQEIIKFIEKNYGTQQGFQDYILNSFSIYFDEIPSELTQFISYFYTDKTYSDEEIFLNVSSFIEDYLESYMSKKISIYQVCQDIKDTLELEDNILVLVEAIDYNQTAFRIYQKNVANQLKKMRDEIYTNKDLEERKLNMIRNHAELLIDTLNTELNNPLDNNQQLITIIEDIKDVNSQLFSKYSYVVFKKDILNLENSIDKNFKNYHYIQPIKRTLNMSFTTLVKDLIYMPELLEELKTKLIFLNIKLCIPCNKKKPAQLNYFVKLLEDNFLNMYIDEENDIYLPIILDFIIAPYLIETLDKNNDDNILFFKSVDDKNIFSYLVKYYANTLRKEENVIRNVMRFIHTEDPTKAKRFATQKIDNIPTPPINLLYYSKSLIL